MRDKTEGQCSEGSTQVFTVNVKQTKLNANSENKRSYLLSERLFLLFSF